MNPIIEQIKAIATKYEVSQDRIAEILVEIIVKAYNKQIPDQVIDCQIDFEQGKVKTNKHLKVISDDAKEGEYDDFIEIPLSQANANGGNYAIGDEYLEPIDIFAFFQSQEILTMMQVFRQKLLEINNQKVYEQWKPHIGELINCVVEKRDDTKGFCTVELGDGNIGFLSRSETIPGEDLKPGSRYQFYVKDVKEQSKGWPIILSRADAQFVLKLLELEVPEIASGEIKVERIERIAGFKTKLAVSSDNTSYDPASVVVGQRGSRIKAISEILHGEKIEVIRFTEDKKQLLIAACGANNLVGINYAVGTAEGEQDYATLITIEKLLPVIIGKKGNNIKLISKLVNCGIDINTVEEAKLHNIKYDEINSPEALNEQAASPNAHGHRFNNNQRSFQGTYMKPKMVINNQNNSDNILEQLNNMSTEEVEAEYGINLDVDTSVAHTDPQPINYDAYEEEDDVNQMEYENNDLADAFADEIAGLNDEDDK